MIATFWDLAAEHVASFGFGLVLGFIGSSRYRIVKRSNNGGPDA
jgi:hypothetical protein